MIVWLAQHPSWRQAREVQISTRDYRRFDSSPAMLDGEATVKTFKRKDGHVWLMPHNDAYEPIPGDEATILGKVVAVLRRL